MKLATSAVDQEKNFFTALFFYSRRLAEGCALIIYIVLFLVLDPHQSFDLLLSPYTYLIIIVQILRHNTFGQTLGYHRYFSHRAFQCSPWFEAFLAYSACASNMGAISFWIKNHLQHHRQCDTSADPHSPSFHSWLYAWIGWAYNIQNNKDAYKHHSRLAFIPRCLDSVSFVVPWFEFSIVWFFTESLQSAALYSFVPAVACLLLALHFNVATHKVIPSQDGDVIGCQALNRSFAPSMLFGEHAHLDHHIHPRRLRYASFDPPYALILRPLQLLGVVSPIRAVTPKVSTDLSGSEDVRTEQA